MRPPIHSFKSLSFYNRQTPISLGQVLLFLKMASKIFAALFGCAHSITIVGNNGFMNVSLAWFIRYSTKVSISNAKVSTLLK